jgi:hypothetical protein
MVDEKDVKLLDVLPQVDSYIQQATGRDWTKDSSIHAGAKAAARLYLALTYDLMSMQQNQIDALNRALTSSLTQLESIAQGMKAVDNVNSAIRSDDMKVYLTNEALGLNLIDFKKLNSAVQLGVATAILTARPDGGYIDSDAIQIALNTAVGAVI